MKFTGLGSFQYGAEAEKSQQQLASEKEIQMQLQVEVRLPWAPGGPGTLGQLPDSPERTSSLQQGLGLSFPYPQPLAQGLAGGSSFGV